MKGPGTRKGREGWFSNTIKVSWGTMAHLTPGIILGLDTSGLVGSILELAKWEGKDNFS